MLKGALQETTRGRFGSELSNSESNQRYLEGIPVGLKDPVHYVEVSKLRVALAFNQINI
jgi:hypothetical protein